jgi:protein-tyrosine kinase
MGKIHNALEKARRESIVINKGLEESVPHETKRVEAPISEAPVVTMPQVSEPKLKRRIFTRKKNGVENIDFLVTEQFRMLKTRVLHTHNGNPPRTLLITSVLPFEGKSTVATNLAVSLAQGIREHVLLVDCDFRNPHIHKLFGLSPQKGLADYLSGNVDLSEILLKTDTPKLTVVPVGKKPSSPLDLLASEKMKHLIRELKARYNDRYIVFDSTPVQLTSEPMVLLSQVDGIVLVVKAGKTNREMVQRAMQDMERKRLLGIVLNGIEKSLSTKEYYYQYQYC